MLPTGPSFNRPPKAPPTGPRALLSNSLVNGLPPPSQSNSSSASTASGPRTDRNSTATSGSSTSSGTRGTIKINISGGWTPGGKHLHPSSSAASISSVTGTIGRMTAPTQTTSTSNIAVDTTAQTESPPRRASTAALQSSNSAISYPTSQPPPPPSDIPPPPPSPPASPPPPPPLPLTSLSLQPPSAELAEWPGLLKVGKSWRTVYDPMLDKSSSRKGKELVYRYDGESGSDDPDDSLITTDPRLTVPIGRAREGRGPRRPRNAFYHVTYQWDGNSTCPPPPAPPRSILVSSLFHLTPSAHIRSHFGQYGVMEEFSQQMDNITGAPLGICWIKYAGEREAGGEVPGIGEQSAAQVVKAAANGGMKVGVGIEANVVEVVFDGDGSLCKKRVQEAIDKLRPPQPPISRDNSLSYRSPSKEHLLLPSIISSHQAQHTQTPSNPPSFKHPHPTQHARPNGLPPPPHLQGPTRHPPPNSTLIPSGRSPFSSHSNAGASPPARTPIYGMPGSSPSYPYGIPIPPSPAHTPSGSSAGPPRPSVPPPLNHPLPQRPISYSPVQPSNKISTSLHPQPQAIYPQKDYSRVKDVKDATPGLDRDRDGGRDKNRQDCRRSPSPRSSRERSIGSGFNASGGPDGSDGGRPSLANTPNSTTDPVRRNSHSLSPVQRMNPPRLLSNSTDGEPNEKSLPNEDIIRELAHNGCDHIRIRTGSLLKNVRPVESDWRDYFDGFGVDKVLCDLQGWYITFTTPTAARQSSVALDQRLFLSNPIDITVHTPPTSTSALAPNHTITPPFSVNSPTNNTKTLSSEERGKREEGLVKGAVPIVVDSLKEAFQKELKERAAEMVLEVMNRVAAQEKPVAISSSPPGPPPEDQDLTEILEDSRPLSQPGSSQSVDEPVRVKQELQSQSYPPSLPSGSVPGKTLSSKKNGNSVAKPSAKSSTATKAAAKKKLKSETITPPSSKPKPADKNQKKRALKEVDDKASGVDEMDLLLGDEPPKKRQKKRPSKSVTSTATPEEDLLASAILPPVGVAITPVDDDATNYAGDEDATSFLDELVGGDMFSTSMSSARATEDAALELESFTVGAISSNGAGGGEQELDVEAELLKAVGIEDEPITDTATSTGAKRSRSSTTEIREGNGRARKKTRVPYPAAQPSDFGFDNEEELVAALNPPTINAAKKKGKARGKVEDTAYHFTFKNRPSAGGPSGGIINIAPTKPSRSASNRPSAASKKSKPAASVSTIPPDTSNFVEQSIGRPPSPERPTAIVRPPRPRIPPIASLDAIDPAEEIAALRRSTKSQKDVRRRSPSPNPINLGLAMDNEELFFLKAGLARRRGEEIVPRPKTPVPEEPSAQKNTQLRVHRTGAARTEGYYKIPEALKSAYLPQRNRAMVLDDPNATRANEDGSGYGTTAAASSRSNRVNARRLVQGMEQTNKAMGDNNTATQLQFNQLRARKKQLAFARSPIHDWGLYAMEAIPQGEMVIEYVGEVIRAQVAEKREKWYERIGIGSSYLFRVDEDLVVDATKKGNLGRLINHCCTPNCNAKIIVVNQQKKIVIYAKTNIEPGDEITYDYHFPLEDEKIPCLCGSSRCRGFLN